MNLKDAIDIVDEGEPNIKLTYNCPSCDDIDDVEGYCSNCGDVLRYMPEHNMNTPYEEYQYAKAFMELHAMERKRNELITTVNEYAENSRYN